MKIKIQIITFILIFINGNIFPQVIQEWVRTYNSNSNLYDESKSMVIDPFGNICVTGVSIQNGSYDDIVTIKYNPDGIQQWARIYQSTGTQYDNSYSIASDEFGNIYVTGSSGYAYDRNIIVLKYDLLGILQWVKTFDGSAHSLDEAFDIKIDNANNVYVTGYITQTASSIDLCILKYSPDGEFLWVSTYNNPLVNKWDWGNALEIEDSCNIYITGFSDNTGVNNADYITLKYDSSGTNKWIQRYNGTGNSFDYSYKIVLDDSCNVFITGLSMGEISAQDYLTIKYNSEGIQQWIQRYNGPGNRYDQATSIITDKNGNVYVTGRSQNMNMSMDFCTIKYSTNGTQLWVQRYLGSTNYSSEAYDMAIDNYGYIYVTGKSINSYVTLKYSSNGIQQWITSSAGSSSYNKILVDDLRNVYITGSANADFITIKYSQPIGINIISNEIPESYSISQNYPNPFNPQTKIKFAVPKASFTKLIVYNLLGREVATLINEELKPGTYETDWDGSNFSSGVYFYKLVAGDPSTGSGRGFVETKKMVLMK